MARPLVLFKPGDTFGYWTVLEYAGYDRTRKSIYKCRCVCGKAGSVQHAALRNGDSKSCGCKRWEGYRRAKLEGKRFGKLFVLRLDPERELGRGRWICQCDCGKTKSILSTSLICGDSTSCGCDKIEKLRAAALKRDPNYLFKEVPRRYIRATKHGAKGREIPFNLTIEEVSAQYEKQNHKCYFTGLPVGFSSGRGNPNPFFGHSASIDRLDSNGGYVASNICIVHRDVNRMKNAFPVDRFLEICRLTAANHPIPIQVSAKPDGFSLDNAANPTIVSLQ